MCVEIPDVRVSEPHVSGNVAVFPLFASLPLILSTHPDYVLGSQALGMGKVTIHEVSENGEVPCLRIDNHGDLPVLFIEGEEVKGGKQNRVLRSSILVASMSSTRIPVVCTELNRWGYSSKEFASGSHCPPSLRYYLKDRSRGQQCRIWATIQQKHRRLGVHSRSENMSDALESRRDAVEDLRKNLPYVEGSAGFAITLAGKVVSMDLFDKPATCKEVYERIVDSLILDALELPGTVRQAEANQISVELYKTRAARWRHVEPVIGLGESYRTRSDEGNLATALVMDNTLVHLSISMQA